MAINIKRPNGTEDVLPKDVHKWHTVEKITRETAESFGFGELQTLRDKATIADGIHVLTPGDLTFRIVEKYVDDIVTVRETEIEAAIVALLEGPKLVAEGAGAAAVAAYMADRMDTGRKTAAVLSGGNIDISALGKIMERELRRRG